jgi:hypothetical protein
VAFKGVTEFLSEEHKSIWCSVLAELTKCRTAQLDKTLTSLLTRLPCDTQRTIQRGKETAGLTAIPSTINSTELPVQEFRDQLLLQYARSLGDLPLHCDICNQSFSVHQHVMMCKKGGLVIIPPQQDER